MMADVVDLVPMEALVEVNILGQLSLKIMRKSKLPKEM